MLLRKKYCKVKMAAAVHVFIVSVVALSCRVLLVRSSSSPSCCICKPKQEDGLVRCGIPKSEQKNRCKDTCEDAGLDFAQGELKHSVDCNLPEYKGQKSTRSEEMKAMEDLFLSTTRELTIMRRAYSRIPPNLKFADVVSSGRKFEESKEQQTLQPNQLPSTVQSTEDVKTSWKPPDLPWIFVPFMDKKSWRFVSLGKGAYGEVLLYGLQGHTEKIKFAVKIVNAGAGEGAIIKTFREGGLFAKDPNILRAREADNGGELNATLMEIMNEGNLDLFRYVEYHDAKFHDTKKKVLTVLSGFADGEDEDKDFFGSSLLGYVFKIVENVRQQIVAIFDTKNKFVTTDLKSPNVMMNYEEGRTSVHVGDFGGMVPVPRGSQNMNGNRYTEYVASYPCPNNIINFAEPGYLEFKTPDEKLACLTVRVHDLFLILFSSFLAQPKSLNFPDATYLWLYVRYSQFFTCLFSLSSVSDGSFFYDIAFLRCHCGTSSRSQRKTRCENR